MSGLVASAQKGIEALADNPGVVSPGAITAGVTGAAASVVAGYLINKASSTQEAASAAFRQESIAARRHHLRRGLAQALLKALSQSRTHLESFPKSYENLVGNWEYCLGEAIKHNEALDRYFPITLVEEQWEASNSYSSDEEQGAQALIGLLSHLLEMEGIRIGWPQGHDFERFAKIALPLYRQAFAEDLVDDEHGLLKRAFDVKGQHQLLALLRKAISDQDENRKLHESTHALLGTIIGGFPLLKAVQVNLEGLSRFVYEQEVDKFVGRSNVLDRLELSFLDTSAISSPNNFKWHLVLGSAGVGKSRLGQEFAKRALPRWPIAGFINPALLDNPDSAQWFKWRPEASACLVIDNVVRHVDGVRKALDALAYASARQFLEYPVRLLLLEREANSEMVEYLFAHCSDSRAVNYCRFEKATVLKPLERSEYLDIMRGRDASKGQLEDFSDDDLDGALKAIDPNCRPLFAAVVGEELSGTAEPQANQLPSTPERRRELLERVINRERKFWESLASHQFINRRDASSLLVAHERLLTLATITRGFSMGKLKSFGDSVRELGLLSMDEVDPAISARMRDRMLTQRDDFVAPLEPDLIGELYVEIEVAKLSFETRRALVDLAWQIDPAGSGFFASLAEFDYGTVETDVLRFMPSPEVISNEHIAASAAHALRLISRRFTYRVLAAHPETRPPWAFPDFDEIKEKSSMRDDFNRARQRELEKTPLMRGTSI